MILEAAFSERGLELAITMPCRDVGRQVELREMLADDLLGQIALDAFRSAIPRAHATFGIEQQDCVVGDALDEKAKRTLIEWGRTEGDGSSQRKVIVAKTGEAKRRKREAICQNNTRNACSSGNEICCAVSTYGNGQAGTT